MKKTASIFIVLLLLFAILPHTAFGETVQSHTIEADRVLVYNPLPYKKNANTLYSGTFASAQEDADTDGKPIFTPGLHETGKDLSHAEKDPDTHDFWVITNIVTYQYDKCTFRLAAESEHCCIWTRKDDSIAFTQEQIDAMIEQFETVIYQSNTTHFGPFRDLAGNGKLYILTYDMNNSYICGFFDSYDLYSREEIEQIDPDDAESYNCLPIINVNARLAYNTDYIYGTLAHEFQHLILRSAVLASPANADRLGREKSIGLWLNEGFSMAAEEFAYPGSVAEQGYVYWFSASEKVRYGMSYQNFDATSTDVGAYGQSFLFAEYLRTLCGDTVFSDILDYWSEAEDIGMLSEERAIKPLLTAEQVETIGALCTYTDSITQQIGTEEGVLLSKLALSFRIALLLNEESGIYSVGGQALSVPFYSGAGRRIEGGGALFLECDGSFAVPNDADSGLVFVGIKDGAITSVYTVPEPDEGYYVIAAQFGGQWFAVPAAPADNGFIRPISFTMNDDGTPDWKSVRGAIFYAERTDGGYRFTCDGSSGVYALCRAEGTNTSLSVSNGGSVFAWSHFIAGTDRLQADGYYGRAILYGSFQGGFGYFASGFFNNESFSQPQLIHVEPMRGDANLDGRVTAADAALVLQNVVSLSYLTAPMRKAADMNGDDDITAEDAVKILRIIIKLED